MCGSQGPGLGRRGCVVSQMAGAVSALPRTDALAQHKHNTTPYLYSQVNSWSVNLSSTSLTPGPQGAGTADRFHGSVDASSAAGSQSRRCGQMVCTTPITRGQPLTPGLKRTAEPTPQRRTSGPWPVHTRGGLGQHGLDGHARLEVHALRQLLNGVRQQGGDELVKGRALAVHLLGS